MENKSEGYSFLTRLDEMENKIRDESFEEEISENYLPETTKKASKEVITTSYIVN